MLVGLGHDIQQVSQLRYVKALRRPGLFFTERETESLGTQTHPIQSLAANFAAKEAFFKALPYPVNFFWTDVEVLHDQRGKPFYSFDGNVARLFSQSGWRAALSISHSHDYVSVVTLITDYGL